MLGYVLLAVLLGLIGLAWHQERDLLAWQAKTRASLEARAGIERQRLDAARARASAPSGLLVEAGLGLRPASDPEVRAEFIQRWRDSGAVAAWLIDFTGEPILAVPEGASLTAGVTEPLALSAGLRGQTGSVLSGQAAVPTLRLYVPLHAGEAGRSQVAVVQLFDFALSDWLEGADADFTLLLAPDGRVVAGEPAALRGQRLPAANSRLQLAGIGNFARVDVRFELGGADESWGVVRLRPLNWSLPFTPWLHWGGAAVAILILVLFLAHLVERQRRSLEQRHVASAAVRAPSVHLPYIEGLDLDAGLFAVEGDEARYLDRLRVFLLEEGKRLRLIHAHLVEGCHDAAEAAVAEAQEAARQIGAGVLQSRLNMLHASVRRRDPAAQIEPRLRDAAAELDKTLRAIWAGLDKVDYLPPGMAEPPAPIGEAEIALSAKSTPSDLEALDFDVALEATASPARTAPSLLQSLLERIERNDPDTLAYLKANQVALARTITPRTVVELNRRIATGDWPGAAALCRESL